MTETELFLKWKPWADNVVRQTFRRSDHLEDAQQAGGIGLLEAIRKWDGVRNFKTFAYRFVSGHAIDELRSWAGRKGSRGMLSLDYLLEVFDGSDERRRPRCEPIASEDCSTELLDYVDIRTRKILYLYYWENRTDKEIAEKIGLSSARVNVIRQDGLEQLRWRLR